MIGSNKNVLLAAILLCGTIGFSNCSSAPTTQTTSNATVVTSNTNSLTAASSKTGVAECDEYIEKYEACLTKIGAMSPQIESTLKNSFEQQRKAFKEAAAYPDSKAGLTTGCKQAIEAAKQSTGAYGCAW